MKRLTVTGLNHRTAELSLREQLSFQPDEVEHALTELLDKNIFRESVIVSTCNRTEIYGVSATDDAISQHSIADFLTQHKQLNNLDISNHLYHYPMNSAVQHLFKVTAGLDAMVLGETQILGQTKQAFSASLEHGSSGKHLNALFQIAFIVAKTIHNSTQISESKLSVASIAVDFASDLFSSFANKNLLLIGAGETGVLVLKHFREHGLINATIGNRSYDKALKLAESCNGQAFPLQNLDKYLHKADIIVTAVDADNFVITPEMMKTAILQRKNRPLFMLDLSVPRAIHPEVNALGNVFLYNMDALKTIVDDNLNQRHKELDSCLAIVETEAKKFLHKAAEWDVVPVIQDLNAYVHDIREEEWNRLQPKLDQLDDKLKQDIEYAMNRIAKRILHTPMTNLRGETHKDESFQVIDLFKRLFKKK